jgi:hypothetical protein
MVILHKKFVFSLFSCLYCSVSIADDLCIESMLTSLKKNTDLSSCNLLHNEKKEVIVVSDKDYLYFRSDYETYVVFYRMDLSNRSISIKKYDMTPWKIQIKDRQTFPDAKQFYFPFFLGEDNRPLPGQPDNPQFLCKPVQAFDVDASIPCA